MAEIRWHEGTASHMQIKENKGVTWLTYPAFEQFADIVHGFSTRLGGVSEGIYASMNLSFTRGDKDAAVYENYRRFAAALGFSERDIVTSDHIRRMYALLQKRTAEMGLRSPDLIQM